MQGKDLGQHLNTVLSLHKDMDTLKVLLTDGSYRISTPLVLSDFDGYLQISGSLNTRLVLTSTFINIRGISRSISLEQEARRNNQKITLKEKNIPVGSLVVFASNDTVESAWNYKQADVGRITQSEGNRYTLEGTLNFSYKPGSSELIAFRYAKIYFENLRFEMRENVSAIIVHGTSFEMTNCEIVSQADQRIQSCVNLYNCENLQIRDCSIQGDIAYGFLLNNCRNVQINNIKSKECLHPVVPAYWSSDIDVDGFIGEGSLIDAHPSFNVSYKNVVTTKGKSYWNCRALGVKLENCNFQIQPGVKDQSIYLGVVSLEERYAFLYDEYDIYCKNVIWKYEDLIFNGLHVHKCKDFIVEGCTTHAVSTGMPIRRFEVSHSNVGRVYGADSNFKVTNTTFNQSLQNSTIAKSPLRCSYSGQLTVEDCKFVGYADVHLFDYIQSATTAIRFINCEFNQLKGFVKNSYRPREEYNNIRIMNSRDSKHVASMFKDIQVIQSSTD